MELNDQDIRDIAKEIITNPRIVKLIRKNHEKLVKQNKNLEFHEETDILFKKLLLKDRLDLITELLKINKELMNRSF